MERSGGKGLKASGRKISIPSEEEEHSQPLPVRKEQSVETGSGNRPEHRLVVA